MDEKDLQNYIEWAKRGNLSNKAAARYFQLSGLTGDDFNAAMSQMPVDVDPNVYIKEEEKQPDPYAGFQPMEQEQIKGMFDNDLNLINSEVVTKSEEEAVGFLRNKYNRYGFKFEESVPGFDFIKITAPNGESEKFQFALGMSEEDQQYFPGYEKRLSRNASDLVSWMNKNMVEDAQTANYLAKSNYIETPKYLDRESIDKDSEVLSDRAKSLQSEISFYDDLTRAYEVAVLNGEQEEADKIASEARDLKKDLENKRASIEEDFDTFNASFGSWYNLKANQGTWVGAAMNMLGSTLDGVVEGTVNQILDLPVAAAKGLTDEQRRARKIDYTAFEDIMKTFSGTTDEYVEDVRFKVGITPGLTGEAARGILGLIDSAPAFLAPSKFLRMLSMSALVLNEVDKEMSGPEFKDVSENQKWLVKAPLAVVTAVLEEKGFRNAKTVNALAPKLLFRALSKTPKVGTKWTPKTLAEFVEQDVSNSLARGALVLGGAFASEAETGALQEIAATEIKRIWNLSREKTDFDVPGSMGEYLKRVSSAAFQEGVGGFVLGSRSAYKASKSDYFFSDKELTDLMLLSNEEVISFRKKARELQVPLGKMTAEKAQADNETDRKIHEIAKQIPSDASVSTQKQLFRKLQREAGLKESVARKGVRMGKREQKDLDDIRKDIDEIGDTYERLTPEQKEQELREIIQPITPTGGTVVETAGGQKIEIQPEEVTPEEDAANQAMEEAPQSEEGVQLSLFDETEGMAEPQAEEPSTEQPAQEPQQRKEDVADFAEIEVEGMTPGGLAEAGFSPEFQAIIGRVIKAVGKLPGGKGQTIRNHRTKASIDAYSNEAERLALESQGRGNEFVPIKFGEFVYGFVNIVNGQPTEVHLLDTNSAEFVESVKEAAREQNLSYAIPSATDLVSEELITHYMLYDMFGANGTKREEFYNKLEELSKNNPALKALIDRVRADYFKASEAKKQEEVIAAFFIDYRKEPSRYRSVWQRIKDWFNNLFAGKRVINNEQDLFAVANQVVNILKGKSVKLDIQPGAAPPQQQADEVSQSRQRGEFTYLQNETIYYDFDRQAGVEYMEWATVPPPVPQKIKVNDFYHFRNWYNKMTANQEYPGIITNMYIVKDGKRQKVNPPKPRTDAEGNKVVMQRMPTRAQIKSQRFVTEQGDIAESRRQYSEMIKEVGDLLQNSVLAGQASLQDFYPEGKANLRRGEQDFEGLIIAKKNIQAAIDSGITEEQLKEMRGTASYVSKQKHPELFNMSGIKRFNEAGQGDIISNGEISFSRTSGYEASKEHIKHFTGGKKELKGSQEDLNGKRGVSVGFDASYIEREKKNPSGIKKQSSLKISGKGVDPNLKGNEIISTHLNTRDAASVIRSLEVQANLDALSKRLKPGERGEVVLTFNSLNLDSIAANPYVAATIALELKKNILESIEKGNQMEWVVEKVQNILNTTTSNIGYTSFEGGKEMVVQKIRQAYADGEKEMPTKTLSEAFEDVWVLKNGTQDVIEILDSFIKGEVKDPFATSKKSFIDKIAKIIGYEKALDFAQKNDFLDPFLNDENSGHIIAYRTIPYIVREDVGVDLGLVSAKIPNDIGFKGAIVSKTKNFETRMKFMPELIPINESYKDFKGSTIGETQTESARGNVKGEISFSRASGRVSQKVVDVSGVKGVPVNSLLQIMGKASQAEQAVLQSLLSVYPNVKFIPKEDVDEFFEKKMLQPLDEVRDHADYGLDRLYGRRYRKLVATTVPFLGDPEIYGTAGVYGDHFDYPVHAHMRMFTDPEQPGILYVSELQSDTYQKGLEKSFGRGQLPDSVIIQEYASDEFDVSVQNLEFLKHILENYDDFRSELISAAGGKENAFNADWWDDVLKGVENVSDERAGDAPNVANLLSNTLKNDPNFNVRALRILLRQFAMSNLNAPINSTEKQIEDIINDHFNKYPFVQPGEKNNLGGFASDLVITIDYMADAVADIAIGEELVDASQKERMAFYNDTVKVVERHRKTKDEGVIEGVSSAKNSWEKQIIRYAVKRAQENGDKVVRLPTEKTAADVQWWNTDDADLEEYMSQEFGVESDMEGPMTQETLEEQRQKQAPLRKRYMDLPKTLRSIGLDSRLARDENGNKWYEVDVPAPDYRMVMFSKSSGRNNLGDIGGATWDMREQSNMDDFADVWLTRLQDKYRRVFKLQEDVAKGTQGQVRKEEDFRTAEELMYGKAANDLERLDQTTKDISNKLKNNGLTVQDLDEYMYNLHVEERNAVISERTEGKNQNGSGKTNEQAAEYFANLSEDKRGKLEDIAKTVRLIQQDTRDTMVNLGLETQETIDAFEEMFSNYVPLQGRANDEGDLGYSPYPNGGTGFSVTGSTTKRAKGRGTQADNIVAQVISQNAAVRIKGRTNEAMNALYKLVENNPNPDVWQVLDKEENGYKNDDPNIVSVRVDGVQKAIRFKDPSYAQALRSMNLPQTNHFVKMMGSLNSWLRAAFTSRNPEFILSNFSRDIQSAIFNASAETDIEGGFLNGTDAMGKIFKVVGPSLKALVRNEVGASPDPLIMKYYEQFKEDGGKTGWAYQKSLEDIAAELEIDDSGKTGAQKIIGGVKGALEFVEGMNDAFENSIRLSAYIAAREGGISREKSAQFAKNITVNFNKQGEWGAAVNATYLFFNASVQGSARIFRSLGSLKPPMRPDGSRREWYERATTSQKAALGMVIMNGLLTMLNRAASDDDEDGQSFYNKIPDYIKERNLIIMRPDGKNYWKVPMPYGYNIFANLGSTSVEVASGDRQAIEGLAFFSMSMINAFSPISFGQSDSMAKQLAKTSIPTAFKPFFEAYAFNETYFGGPVKAEQYPFGTPKPNSSMSFRSPEELKQFFSWMNEATGGSRDVPGYVDVNPDGAWYIFEYFLGGTGRFVTRSIETGRKIAADSYEDPVNLDFNDVPFMRIVYGEPSKYYDMQKFKEREVEVKQLVAEYKNNRIPDAKDRYTGIGLLNGHLKDINKALKQVRAEKRAAIDIKDYGERVSKIQSLQERERRIVMMFNKKYEEVRGKN